MCQIFTFHLKSIHNRALLSAVGGFMMKHKNILNEELLIK